MAAFYLFIHRSDDVTMGCERIEGIEPDAFTLHMIESRLQDMQMKWDKLNESFEATMIATDTTQEQKESVKAKFNTCSDKFHECRSFLKEMHDRIAAPAVPPIMPQPLPNMPAISYQTNIAVPPCDIKIFEGSYEEWPTFRDLFVAIFVDNPGVNDIQKLFHLRKRVKGDAENIVKRYPLSAQSFSLAWEALKNRYENKRLLVDNHLKTLLNLPKSSEENSKSIQLIQTTISDTLANLAAQGVNIENWDPFIVYMCSTKLPKVTLSLWEQSLSSRRELPKWSDMEKFLISRFEVVERVNGIQESPQKTQNTNRAGNSNNRNNSSGNSAKGSQSNVLHSEENLKDSPQSCAFCKKAHHLRNCLEFTEQEVKERREFVKKHKICFNCLSSNHFIQKCPSKNTCNQCKKSHHSLLHLSETPKTTKKASNKQAQAKPNKATKANYVETIESDSGSNSESSATLSNHAATSAISSLHAFNTSNVLLPTAIVTIRHEGELFTARALIDPGSQSSFITTRVQQRLALPTKPVSTSISAMGGRTVKKAKQVCFFDLVAPKVSFETTVRALVLSKLTNFLPSANVSVPDLACFGKIKLADPNFSKPGQIDLLLGSDVIPQILRKGLKKSNDGALAAQNTVFGWFLSGSVSSTNQNSVQTYSTIVDLSEDTQLNDQLRKFWEIEEIPQVKPVSEADQYCEDLYQRTTTREKDGRYMVRLPFKDEFPDKIALGPSRHIAIKQYQRIEESLAKNVELNQKYTEVLNEYVVLKHMSPTSQFESKKDGSYRSFYLPHHAVIKPDSVSTKVRVVFNASRRTQNGASLNEVLHIGPTLQNDLMSTILRWRTHRFVYNGDIEKMYRQILVHPEDRSYQKIVFRPDPQGPVQDFQLNTVTFGVNCAPFLAIRTIHQLAEDTKVDHPTASSVLKNDIYVDDILSGSHDIDDAIFALNDIIEVLKSANLPLKKITANHPKLLQSVPPADRLSKNFLEFEDTSSTKTLGVKWNASHDFFFYSVKKIEPSESITKRKMLSISASWYDPAGWLAPFTIRAKLLIQELWLQKEDWDACVNPRTLLDWNRLVEKLSYLEQIKVPRWLGTHPDREIQLHGFCDASERGYCACIYVRSASQGENVETQLLVAKSKVAPVQTVSLPRLELCAAHLLSKLVKAVRSQLDITISQEFYWSDSTITLAWLEKPPYLLKTYVANRVSQIIANVGNAKWRHVPTAENSADLGTRGVPADELVTKTLWWEGPHWLKDSPDKWPKTPSVSVEPPELRRVEPFHYSIKDEEILDRYSSLSKALRIVARILRFYVNCQAAVESRREANAERERQNLSVLPYKKRKLPSRTAISQVAQAQSQISSQEIAQAKTRLIIVAQEQFYAIERHRLRKKEPLPKRSPLVSLNPFLDSAQVLRVDGRLKNANLPYEEKHPIIVPEKSRLCSLLIDYTHQRTLHADLALMTRTLREGYYIPRLKNKLKFSIRQCKACTLYKNRTKTQIMAALPPERVEMTLAFATTGLDFAGPFLVKTGLTRRASYAKAYVCLFVCFVTKAIHLELCPDLSTRAFLDTFQRFVGRRGLPAKVVSDNGRNFVGANRALQKDFKAVLAASSQAPEIQTQGVQWSFIPPGAPHMGGLWESAVKSCKMHLTKVAGNQKFTFVELTTLLVRIEAVLNSRPISATSTDPSDLLPLTPAHFLRGGPLLSAPEPGPDNLSLVNRWEKMKALYHQFSRRWKDEYLHGLQKRNKWRQQQKDIAKDDLVIIKDDNQAPTEWRMGRVLEVYPGRDARVRAAKLKTSDGILIRPIVKLVVLPMDTRPIETNRS